MRRTVGTRLASTTILMLTVGAAFTVLAMGSAAASGGPCSIVVSHENVGNNALQTAINSAHAGETICIGHGSFPEQITIATPNLRLVGAGVGVTTIAPTAGVVNAVDWDSASNPEYPLIAVVLIDNVSGVTIAGLTVNAAGAAASITGCTPGIVGVDFQNVTSGALVRSVVTGAELSPALLGCQSQSDVYAYTGYYTTGYTPASASVTFTADLLTAYGKGGLVCDDPGLTCTVTATRVVGIGPTPAIAANGIQVAFGAVGHLVLDSVSANAYTGPYEALDWYGTAVGQTVGYESAGILLYQAGAGTRVIDCRLLQDADGIAAYQDASDRIAGNVVTDSSAYGIVENGLPTTTATLAANVVRNPVYGAPGILVDNGTFTLQGNVVASALATGDQGASQAITGANTYYPTAPAASVNTAAFQAVSEGGATHVILLPSNEAIHCSARLATQSVFSGSVQVTVV
jgi:hypothetical protein